MDNSQLEILSEDAENIKVLEGEELKKQNEELRKQNEELSKREER